MEYTVVGDAVNVAARLEALARPRQTLATKEVVDLCPRTTFTSLGPHALRGKAQPVEVFEVAPGSVSGAGRSRASSPAEAWRPFIVRATWRRDARWR